MSNAPYSLDDLRACLTPVFRRNGVRKAVLFGSYARGEATASSDIDVIVVGGERFRARDIFAFGEELRQRTQKDVDAFEIREVNVGTPFYENVMREGVKIA